MNSSQRRKNKREFPHVIKLVASNGDPYIIHDDTVLDARKWCRHNCKASYKVETNWDMAEFKFATERDAVYFALKWL